jgi:hypothetical protein
MALALNVQALYGPLHSAVLDAAEDIARMASLLPAEDAAIQIDLSNDGALAGGQGISLPREHVANLLRCCRAHAVDQITVRSGVEALEVGMFLRLFGNGAEELREHGGLASALPRSGVTHIACRAAGAEGGHPLVDASLLRTGTTALELIQESEQQARVGGMLNASAARALASELADDVIGDRAKLLGLLSMHRHDEYTFQHSLNVCLLALSLGMAVGLGRAHLEELGLAALFHDLGKAWVPLEVLRKPCRLDREEIALIRRHPVDGAMYLSGQLDLPPAVVLVTSRHHLRYDQRGYPELRWPMPADPYSLIVGVADAYEALTSDRPYRRTRSPDEALRVMQDSAAGQFEPRLLKAFGEMIRRSRLLGDPSAGLAEPRQLRRVEKHEDAAQGERVLRQPPSPASVG